VVLSTRYAQLAESMRAEEVATKADLDLADRIRDSWDKDSRNEDMAHRKQDWHAEKLRKISGPTASWAVPGDLSAREIISSAGKHEQAAGQASSSSGAQAPTTLGGAQASDPEASLARKRHAGPETDVRHFPGSSARATRGPEAAGGPGATEPPSARGGEDREERAAPPGRLAPVVGRQAGLPEPFAALKVTGNGQGPVDRFSSGTVSQALQVGATPLTLHSAHLALEGALEPD
jgi:hypothetical protein